MTKYSVSIHNGTQANRGHNARAKESIYNQGHINPQGEFIILKDEDPKEVYEHLFGEAVKSYNEKQNRKDRKINNYYDKINANKDKKNTQNPIYEVIVAVGNYDEHIQNEAINKKILTDYVEQWEQRNPNLYMVGAYLHNDEIGAMHLHIDYIPIAHYTSGLTVRNGLNKALNEMGYTDGKFSNTPQMRWQKNEQSALMEICSQYNIQTENKQSAKREHYTTEEYKALKQLEDKKNQLEVLELNEKLKTEQYYKQIDNREKTLNRYDKTISNRTKELEELNSEFNDLIDRAEQLSEIMEQEYNEITEKHYQKLENEIGEFSKQLKPKENDYELEL